MATSDLMEQGEHRQTQQDELSEEIHAKLVVGLFDALAKLDNPLNVSELAAVGEDNQLTELIERVADDWMLKILCAVRPELVRSAAKDLAAFIEKTRQQLATFPDLQQEAEQLDELKKQDAQHFLTDWPVLQAYLTERYSEFDLNLTFYKNDLEVLEQDLKTAEEPLTEGEESHDSTKPLADIIEDIELLKEHLEEAWTELLRHKEQSETLKALGDKKEQYCKGLSDKIMKYQKIHNKFTELSEDTGQLWDLAEGDWQKSDFKVMNGFLRRLKKDKNLMRLADMLGRHRKTEVMEYEEKFINQEEWIAFAVKSSYTGIRQSADLDSVLPSEIALLADPETEGLFVKRLAEKKLQTFDYQDSFMDSRSIRRLEKVPKRDKGPFVLCVDTSASMLGKAEDTAKMLCLAILKVALKEKRPCYLIAFSTATVSIDLTNLKAGADSLLQFLSRSFNGGTDLHPALRETLKVLDTKAFRKADVLVISDFKVGALDVKMVADIEAAKKKRTKFYSVLVQKQEDKDNFLQQFGYLFDHNWYFDKSNSEAVLEMIGELRREM